MEVRELVVQIERQAIIALGGEDLPVLLEAAEVIRAVDTCVAGWIRILRIDGHFVVQEQTPEGEILIRRLRSHAAAESFIEDRLNAYERMWDGCGCKIEYHN